MPVALLSLAAAVTVTAPFTAAPSAGALILMVGAVLSVRTATVLAVVTFPAASYAFAERLWFPSAAVVVFHVQTYGATLL
jgi:hypothetical protein